NELESSDAAERHSLPAVEAIAAAVRPGCGDDQGVVAAGADDVDAGHRQVALEAGRARLSVYAGGQERRESDLAVGIGDLAARSARVARRRRSGGRAPPVERGIDRTERLVVEVRAGVAAQVVVEDRGHGSGGRGDEDAVAVATGN